MKILENINLYSCDFCKKISISKVAMKLHENACKQNPINKTDCARCLLLGCHEEFFNYQIPSNDIYGDYQLIESFRTTFICKADCKTMYHRNVLKFEPKMREDILSSCDKMMPAYGCCDMIEPTQEHDDTIRLLNKQKKDIEKLNDHFQKEVEKQIKSFFESPIKLEQRVAYNYKCCEKCSNNPKNNPNASAICYCVLPQMEKKYGI